MEQELRISQRAKQYPASGIRKMFDLAAQYPEAIKLTVGEPNFDTPQYIKDAAKRALDEGQTHYAPNAGTTELREAVAAKYRKQYWEGYTKDHVIITVGAMEGLFLAMMTLLDPGDEILVPDPCFPNYYGQASSIGARAVPVPTYEEYDYRIQAADIEKAVTPRTRAILLNSPCNPTGAVLTKEDILLGVSAPRNEQLANVFYRLRLIEAYGTGMPKIQECYREQPVQPVIEIADHAFKVTLPNLNYGQEAQTAETRRTSGLTEREATVLALLEERGSITRREVEKALGVSQATAILALREMTRKGLLRKTGGGRTQAYCLPDR